MKYAYYYEEIPMDIIFRTKKKLEAKLEGNSSTTLTLKNGQELLVGRKPNGDIQIYDNEPNLLAEFSNTGYNEYCNGQASFNASVFLIRAAKKPI